MPKRPFAVGVGVDYESRAIRVLAARYGQSIYETAHRSDLQRPFQSWRVLREEAANQAVVNQREQDICHRKLKLTGTVNSIACREGGGGNGEVR